MSNQPLPVRRLVIASVLLVAACGQTVHATAESTAAPTPSAAALATVLPTVSPTEPPATKAPWALFPAYPTAQLPIAAAAKLQAVLDSLVAKGSPDAVAAVATAEGVWAGAAGVDGPNARAAEPTDVFNIASVSKPILAAYILKLAQDGKMDLEVPLASYLGDLPIDANGATVRQALEMHAGFGDTPSSAAGAASKDCARVWSRTDALVSVPAPVTLPGGVFMYSNPSYKILGYAAEHASGQSLDAGFDAAMFKPLGLDRILLQGPARKTPKPWALPTGSFGGSLDLAAFGKGGTLPCVSLSTFSFSGSAVASDAPSLARWAWGLFAGELIRREGLDEMTATFDGVHGFGIDLLVNFQHDLAYGVHGGNVGYAAFLTVMPERQSVAVVLVNDQEADVEGAARDLLKTMFP